MEKTNRTYSDSIEPQFTTADTELHSDKYSEIWMDESVIPERADIAGKYSLEESIFELDINIVYSLSETEDPQKLLTTGVEITTGLYTHKVLSIHLHCNDVSRLANAASGAIKRLEVRYINKGVPPAILKNVLFSMNMIVTGLEKFAEHIVHGTSVDEGLVPA